MAFCSKCGSELQEGTKYCASCGEAVTQNNDTAGTQSAANELSTSINRIAGELSLTPKLMGAGAGFAVLFLYYLINYLGSWSLGFWTFLNNLLVPVLYVGLILTQAKNKNNYFYFIVPIGLRALCVLYFMFRSLTTLSFSNGIVYLAHMSLAVLFVLTALRKYDGKKIMLGISAAVGVFAAIFAFRNNFIGGVMQLVYFGSLFALIMELNLPSADTVGTEDSNKP